MALKATEAGGLLATWGHSMSGMYVVTVVVKE